MTVVIKSKPRVSEKFVRKSLAKHEGRQHYRYEKVRFFRHDSRRPKAERKKLEEKWLKKAHESDKAIILRRAQLKWYEDRKPKNHVSKRQVAVSAAISYAKIGVKEHPSGSNSGPYITNWQKTCAAGGSWLYRQPWCGVFCWNMLRRAGVQNLTARMASVTMIEDDARAKRYCYSGWSNDGSKALHGDLAVIGGRGVHVEIVKAVTSSGLKTIGGNTSKDNRGSQSNGGCVAERFRPWGVVHGIAHIDFPNN